MIFVLYENRIRQKLKWGKYAQKLDDNEEIYRILLSQNIKCLVNTAEHLGGRYSKESTTPTIKEGTGSILL